MELSNKKITVTGGAGFLGSYVVAELVRSGAKKKNISIPRSKEFDLRTEAACKKIVHGQDIVIHLAANVGGIGYNQKNPGSLFYDNLVMGAHLMEEARRAGVSQFVAIGTICSYPKFTPVPFKESDLWNGYPEETNAPYGLAKKMMLVQSASYRQQYDFHSIFLLPVNLYGPGDNFEPSSSHVIPALIRKFVEAQKAHLPEVTVWGTGKPTREFLYVADCARAIVLATKLYDEAEPINIGSSYEISIRKLSRMIAKLVGYTGKIIFDPTKPDGQPRRKLDVKKAQEKFGFVSTTTFEEGLRLTIEWYRK